MGNLSSRRSSPSPTDPTPSSNPPYPAPPNSAPPNPTSPPNFSYMDYLDAIYLCDHLTLPMKDAMNAALQKDKDLMHDFIVVYDRDPTDDTIRRFYRRRVDFNKTALLSQRYSSVPFYSLFLAKLGMKTPVEQYGFYASCVASGYLGGRFALHHYRMLRGAFLNDEAAQKLG
eukprot:Phypoly_transcript_21638.p1 GENE.Phypoly_transcript_21638~~Phypoly_transcript_21638.p1  ORF type:complete len:172 (+),score=17.96 Phypoly_transcript_21638:57-572(+)